MTDLPFDIASLRSAYAAGLKPAEVIETVFYRLRAAADPGIFIHLPEQSVLLAEAEALGPYDESRPLWGVPFAVKDNIDVAGMPTTCACPAFAYTPSEDATVVRLLRQAGAIPVGKTIWTSSRPGWSACARPTRSPATPSTPSWCPAARAPAPP